MLHNRTVIVLGAGASREAGFPTGIEIMREIASILDFNRKPPNGLSSFLHRALTSHWQSGIGEDLRKRIADDHRFQLAARNISLNMSQAASIDSFVNAHSADKSVSDVAKLAISTIILDCERRSSAVTIKNQSVLPTFKPDRLQETWYRRLLNIIVGDVSLENIDLITKDVAFITFNYDRSLEYYLKESLQLYFGLDETAAVSLASEFNIIHPYGSLGPIWGGDTLQFGCELSGSKIWRMAANIRTFSEDNADGAMGAAISRLVREAETLVFLGFAYHSLNMKVITPSSYESENPKRVIGTCFKESGPNQSRFVERIEKMLPRNNATQIELRSVDCNELLKEYAQILMFE